MDKHQHLANMQLMSRLENDCQKLAAVTGSTDASVIVVIKREGLTVYAVSKNPKTGLIGIFPSIEIGGFRIDDAIKTICNQCGITTVQQYINKHGVAA